MTEFSRTELLRRAALRLRRAWSLSCSRGTGLGLRRLTGAVGLTFRHVEAGVGVGLGRLGRSLHMRK